MSIVAPQFPPQSAGPPPKPPTEENFLDLIDKEEGELLAVSLVDEIMYRTKTVIFEKHIESQVLPYAVRFSKDVILSLVEWQFLKRDAGLVPQSNWLPDEEPSPVVIDTWARGCVPIKPPPQPVAKVLAAASSLHNLQASRAALVLRENSANATVQQEQKLEAALPPPQAKAAVETATLMSSAKNLSKGQDKQSVPLGNKAAATKITKTSKISEPSNALVTKSKLAPLVKAASPPPIPKPVQQRALLLNKTLASLAANAESRLAPSFDRFIEEENRKTFEKIARIERDGGKVEFSYDSNGRIVMHHRNTVEKRQRALRQIIKARIPAGNQTLTTSGPITGELIRTLTSVERDGTASPAGSVASLMAAATSGRSIYTEDPATTAQSIVDSIKLSPGAAIRQGTITRRGPPASLSTSMS